MTTVLIVGCGYLGTRVAARLLARGDHVIATTRKPERADAFRRAGIDPFLFDVLSPTPLPAADAVIHAVGFDRTQGVPMRAVYVDGLRNVLARTDLGTRFVHVSSTSVYGQTGGEWVDEDAVTEPRDEAGRVVLEAERLVRDHRRTPVILRFAGTYGPGRQIGAVGLRAGKPVAGDPDKWLNLVHVEDGAAAVVAALSRGEGVLNVADGSPVLRRDYYAHLAALIGAGPPTFAPTPDPANRRIDAARMSERLGVVPRFVDYRAGLADAYHEPHERT
ncbi:MAG: SDR family oxidoreductase [Gemmataceae bacterium]